MSSESSDEEVSNKFQRDRRVKFQDDLQNEEAPVVREAIGDSIKVRVPDSDSDVDSSEEILIKRMQPTPRFKERQRLAEIAADLQNSKI